MLTDETVPDPVPFAVFETAALPIPFAVFMHGTGCTTFETETWRVSARQRIRV